MLHFVHGQPELALQQTSAAVFAAVQRLGLAPLSRALCMHRVDAARVVRGGYRGGRPRASQPRAVCQAGAVGE